MISCGLCEETGLKRVLTRKCERGQNSRLLAVIVRTEHPNAPQFTRKTRITRQLSLFSGIDPDFCVQVKLGCFSVRRRTPPICPELKRRLKALGKGDVLVITRLDRLARSSRDLLNAIKEITHSGATFKSLRDTCDTTNAHGWLILTVLGGLA